MITIVWLDAANDEVTSTFHDVDWSAFNIGIPFVHVSYGNKQKFVVNTNRVVCIEIDRS